MNFKTFTCTLIIFGSFLAKAQNEKQSVSQEKEPKIGLVLSGGGAKGLAHIGVLKVLDSLNVKLDYVAGTSMGAIVGALYASGYSGNQLDSIFQEIDFDKIINDAIPRSSTAFDERDNIEKYAVKLPFEDFKIKLPSALSRGQNTYALLLKLLVHVNEIEDFSDLPIPFFCIATDVENGKQVVLDHGNLTQSVMASGALPSLFQPVQINDKILIDGGVVNNYPVDELRAKGMDLIIGVDVQDGLADRNELLSALDVLVQINNFRTISDMTLKVEKTDVYIKPNIKDFSVVSFGDGSDIIDSGKKAALSKLNILRTIENKSLKLAPLTFKHADSIKLDDILIKGNKNYTRSYILGKLKFKGGETMTTADFYQGIDNVIATNNFEVFEYELKSNENDESYDFIANVRESKISTFLKFGIHYDDLYKSAALINFTRKRLLFKNDVASFDFILGDNVRYNFEYLIDKGFYWSVGLRSRINRFEKHINAKLVLLDDVPGINKVDVKLQDQTNQIYVQTLFRRDFKLSMGLEHKRLEIKSETILGDNINDNYLFENTDYLSLFGSLKLDTYDNKYFPKRGFYFDGDLHIYFYASDFNTSFENFSIAKADVGYAFSVFNKLAFNIQSSGGFKIGDNSTKTLDFSLGGYGNDLINNFIPFVGYDFMSLSGNSFVKASAIMDFEVFKKNHITLEGNWANVEDDIFDTGEWLSLPDYSGYALGYGIETFLGPVQVKYSYSTELKESAWFFNVGFWF